MDQPELGRQRPEEDSVFLWHTETNRSPHDMLVTKLLGSATQKAAPSTKLNGTDLVYREDTLKPALEFSTPSARRYWDPGRRRKITGPEQVEKQTVTRQENRENSFFTSTLLDWSGVFIQYRLFILLFISVNSAVYSFGAL